MGEVGQAQALRIGIAFGEGGKNDRSFNQSAAEGAAKAKEDLQVEIFDFEPTDPSQIGQGVRKFAEEGFDLVVGVGFALEASITTTAKEFQDVKFAVIDSVSPEESNVASLVFREQEGSFLVGYLAGKQTQTGVVGFLGGMDIPLIHRFEAGYRAGVEYACKEDGITCKVIPNYVGTTPAAWNDPAKAKEISAAQQTQGADIIYAAAGGSGLGLIDFVKQEKCLKAADLPSGVSFIRDPFKDVPKPADYASACGEDSRPMFFIGVDANQNYLGDADNNPETLNYGFTSMLKRVDVATYDSIKAVVEGTFKGGLQDFSLANDGVGYALDDFNKALIPADLISKVEAVKQDIIQGKITVPENR
ncbi:MAG: BMP family ABC transporter substrate-binding protein [Cyanobacteriota bacterium]|nr:BMP family ABC transporter substrate-binding protein [Cyanobacteriota bacterium]